MFPIPVTREAASLKISLPIVWYKLWWHAMCPHSCANAVAINSSGIVSNNPDVTTINGFVSPKVYALGRTSNSTNKSGTSIPSFSQMGKSIL